MLYLLLFLLAVVVVAIFFEKAPSPVNLPINPCRVCGAPGQLEQDFVHSHVQCSNSYCEMAGPREISAEAAIRGWNNIASMSTVIAWQFQVSGLALENQRLSKMVDWLAQVAAEDARDAALDFDSYGEDVTAEYWKEAARNYVLGRCEEVPPNNLHVKLSDGSTCEIVRIG